MDTRLLVTLGLVAAVEILVPLGLAFWIARRWHVSWKFFGYGVAVFALFQLFTRIPALQIVQGLIAGTLQQSALYRYGWIVLAAFTAGLFEEGGRYLAYRFLWKEDKTWSRALMYGVGHGGMECFYVAALVVLTLVNIVAIFQIDPATLPADQALLIHQARAEVALMSWWQPLLGGLERMMALAIQVSLSVLVLQVFTRRQGFWWWLALAYHTVVDLVAALMASGLSTVLSAETLALVIEAALLPLALFSLWIIWRLRPREPEVPPASLAEGDVAPSGADSA